MALLHPHPALHAAVPINSMVDGWMGDDWFHKGAFRVESLGYYYWQEATQDSDRPWWADQYDAYSALLAAGSAGALAASRGSARSGSGARSRRTPPTIPSGSSRRSTSSSSRAADRRPDPPCPQLVGPGGYLWHHGGVEGGQAARCGAKCRSRARTMVPPPGAARRQRHRRNPLRQRHGAIFPPRDPEAVSRPLSEGWGAAHRSS
jgi:hypothetical protein